MELIYFNPYTLRPLRLTFYFSYLLMMLTFAMLLVEDLDGTDYDYLWLNFIMIGFSIPHSFIKNFSSINRKTNLVGYIWCFCLMICWITLIVVFVEDKNYSEYGYWLWREIFCWALLWEITLFDTLKIWASLFLYKIMQEKK